MSEKGLTVAHLKSTCPSNPASFAQDPATSVGLLLGGTPQ